MTKISSIFIQALLLLALSITSSSAWQVKTITGKVVGVADGDTITMLDATNRQHRVRFQGIDAPESNQAFGQRSKQSLSEMVFGKPVIVQYDKTDKYGRTVGKVLVEGRDINLEQLRAGMAWFYRYYEKELNKEDRLAYAAAEADARTTRKGLWQDPAPVAPWDFRHPGKETSDAPAVTTTAPTGQIIGNKNSKIYHLSNCPDYSRISPQNRVPFKSEAEAVKAGYRKAKNCP
jgi:endonuclease YncB( thermonuclease family)